MSSPPLPRERFDGTRSSGGVLSCPGSPARRRTLDRASGRFKVVPFHVAGVVQEFPAAPRDSFMVANLAYLERATHDPGPNLLFVKARADPVALARQVAARTRAQGALVKNIR